MRLIDEKLGSSLLAVLVLAGCGGSNEIIDAQAGQPDEAELTAVMQQVVLPAVSRLAAFSPVNQPEPPRADSGGPGEDRCSRFDLLCLSGGYQVCSAAPGGPTTFVYENCVQPTGVVDGSWELNKSGYSATAQFELSVEGLAFSGGVDYALDGLCWETAFDSFSTAGIDRSATLDGSVSYCFASGSTSGQLEISTSGPKGTFDLRLDFDARRGMIVIDRDGLPKQCSVDLVDGTTDCESD